MITYCYSIEVVDPTGNSANFYVEVRKDGTTVPSDSEVRLALLQSLYPILRIRREADVHDE